MIAPSNEKPSVNLKDVEQSALQMGEQAAISAAEAGIAKRSQKAAAVVGKVQQAASMAQTVAGQLQQPPSMPAGYPGITGINGSVAPAGTPVAQAPQAATAEEDTPEEDAASGDYIVSSSCVELLINGNPLPKYESFTLNQSVTGHHTFELLISDDALSGDGTEEETHLLTSARNMLGQPLDAGFYYEATPDTKRYFKGIITDIGFRRTAKDKSYIVLKGGSPTVLLDAAPHIQSFTGITLSDLADKIIGQSGAPITKAIKPAYTSKLVYSCQYNETHYNYLARTAAAWGEWFYYDGQKLFFGKPEKLPDAIKVTYNKDVRQMQTSMNTAHVSPDHIGYSSTNHEPLEAAHFDIEGLDDIGMFALQTSQKLYKTPAVQTSPVRAANNADVKATEKSAATALAASLFTVDAVSTNPYLYPGCVIDFEFYDLKTNKAELFTTLIVTRVEQTISPKGRYYCRFRAIPQNVQNLPSPQYRMPIAEPQLATVTANNDSQGRVKVQFPWQEKPTDFIRMMTPDAGSSDKVGTNRGLVTIPEVGDQVMVGFAHSNPDRPFVMGGMFHGKAGGGGGASNNIKSLTSKSGHTVRLDDGGGITVMDKDQNTIHLDGAGNISVFSKVSISLCCGSGKEGDAPMSAISLDIKGNISMIGKKISAAGSEQVSMGSGTTSGEGENATFTGSGFTLDPKNVSIKAEEKCLIGGLKNLEMGSESGPVTIQAKTDTKVMGEKVHIN